MTLEEYQERITSLLDQHIDNLTDDPHECFNSYQWLMAAVNDLLTEYDVPISIVEDIQKALMIARGEQK